MSNTNVNQSSNERDQKHNQNQASPTSSRTNDPSREFAQPRNAGGNTDLNSSRNDSSQPQDRKDRNFYVEANKKDSASTHHQGDRSSDSSANRQRS